MRISAIICDHRPRHSIAALDQLPTVGLNCANQAGLRILNELLRTQHNRLVVSDWNTMINLLVQVVQSLLTQLVCQLLNRDTATQLIVSYIIDCNYVCSQIFLIFLFIYMVADHRSIETHSFPTPTRVSISASESSCRARVSPFHFGYRDAARSIQNQSKVDMCMTRS